MDMDRNTQDLSSFLDELPKSMWRLNHPLLQFKGYWFFSWVIESLPFIETHYKPLHTDILLASFPKSGTTWLKALTFAILNNHTPNDLLQTNNPHELVPFLERTFSKSNPHKIDEIRSPRIYGTHLPYSMLPENVKKSNSKIIYISRDPADAIVSGWHFTNKVLHDELATLEEYFDKFVQGITPGGPLFDHVLEYWEQRDRENVLFVTYEDLKAYPTENVRRIAEFIGRSLNEEEIEQVLKKTSFEKLSKLDVNSGERGNKEVAEKLMIKNNLFFRNGSVGDGIKSLTPEMRKRLHDIAYSKWEGSGLELKLLADCQENPNPE